MERHLLQDIVTMQSQRLECVWNVTLATARRRFEFVPTDRLGEYNSELAGQQNAYDWVDLIGGFV